MPKEPPKPSLLSNLNLIGKLFQVNPVKERSEETLNTINIENLQLKTILCVPENPSRPQNIQVDLESQVKSHGEAVTKMNN